LKKERIYFFLQIYKSKIVSHEFTDLIL
jgi:hypothetical protein